ncbi:dTDP-4-dehydrorhamnose 3,5-epimerase [Candidatus Saccharibacteria bacterium]|nr:dTDP-4-dehydrorhamnose 3,5-epimerase [Candidatus Saccharibacteria bacterium]MCB9834579.1 dTDP-4-dehydrorhamnose 3,5-epimerase [Candidatus Nomurabacteria bacterium]
MKLIAEPLKGVKVIEGERYKDLRGHFNQVSQQDQLREVGVDQRFVQTNHAFSYQNVIRGLHYQTNQAKLIYLVSGKVLDVFVDVRHDSSDFGKWGSVWLEQSDTKLVYIPVGVLHGFVTVSKKSNLIYQMTANWDPAKEGGINPLDPRLDINWPLVGSAILSDKDKSSQAFGQIDWELIQWQM